MEYLCLSIQHDVIAQTMRNRCVLITHKDTSHLNSFVTRSSDIADWNFWDQPSGLCSMAPFEACVVAYYAWLDPDGNWNLHIADVHVTAAEVAVITNEVRLSPPCFEVCHRPVSERSARTAFDCKYKSRLNSMSSSITACATPCCECLLCPRLKLNNSDNAVH